MSMGTLLENMDGQRREVTEIHDSFNSCFLGLAARRLLRGHPVSEPEYSLKQLRADRVQSGDLKVDQVPQDAGVHLAIHSQAEIARVGRERLPGGTVDPPHEQLPVFGR